MILKHILNLAAVFEQHGVFNDASRPTGIFFSTLKFTEHNYINAWVGEREKEG